MLKKVALTCEESNDGAWVAHTNWRGKITDEMSTANVKSPLVANESPHLGLGSRTGLCGPF